MDIKKACRNKKRNLAVPVPNECGHLVTSPSLEDDRSGGGAVYDSTAVLKVLLTAIRAKLERCTLRRSKVAESLISYYEQYVEYDAMLAPAGISNPWITDSTELWDLEKSRRDISPKRVKRWAFNLNELLQDPVGREQFVRFLDKEFSGENLKFYLALQDLRSVQQSAVKDRVDAIWREFLAPDATVPVNIDSRSYEIVKKSLEKPSRWTFEAAGAHLFHLMKSDSYPRYLRSEMYREFLAGAKKKVSVRGIRSIVTFSNKKEQNA